MPRHDPDGWCTAFHKLGAGWSLEAPTARPTPDDRLGSVASGASGDALVAHVRRRAAVGAATSNAHPHRSGPWVFAYSGSVHGLEFLRTRISRKRIDELGGEADSELLFAYIMTHLDAHGLTDARATTRTDEVLAGVVDELRGLAGFESFNFVLCNGEVLYANRFGRSLHLLERTAYGNSLAMVVVASEAMTEEPWTQVADGSLLRCDPRARRRILFLRGADPRAPSNDDYDELPFTD